MIANDVKSLSKRERESWLGRRERYEAGLAVQRRSTMGECAMFEGRCLMTEVEGDVAGTSAILKDGDGQASMLSAGKSPGSLDLASELEPPKVLSAETSSPPPAIVQASGSGEHGDGRRVILRMIEKYQHMHQLLRTAHPVVIGVGATQVGASVAKSPGKPAVQHPPRTFGKVVKDIHIPGSACVERADTQIQTSARDPCDDD